MVTVVVVTVEGFVPSSTTAAEAFSVNRRLSAVLTANSPSTKSELLGTELAVLEFLVTIIAMLHPNAIKKGGKLMPPNSFKGVYALTIMLNAASGR